MSEEVVEDFFDDHYWAMVDGYANKPTQTPDPPPPHLYGRDR